MSALALICAAGAAAADATRGARLYLRSPSGAPSCIACHGPDPAHNRNNLLNAAGRPQGLLKALNSVAAMGFLKAELGEAEVADLTAYLAQVLESQGPEATVRVWPATLDIGLVTVGASVPVQRVWLHNGGAAALAVTPPQLIGGDGGTLALACPPLLGPAQSCSASIGMQSATQGVHTAALRWQAAAGIAPSLIGIVAVVTTLPTGVLETDPQGPELDWGLQRPGVPGLREVAVNNRGVAPVTLTGLGLSGPDSASFVLDEGGCLPGSTLAPGTRCVARINFAADAEGGFVAALQVRGDGQNAAPLLLRARAARAPRRQLPPQPSGRHTAFIVPSRDRHTSFLSSAAATSDLTPRDAGPP